MSKELEREISSLEKLVNTNKRLIKTYEKMDTVTENTKSSLEKLSKANSKLNERIEKLSETNKESLLTDKKKEKSTNTLSNTFAKLRGTISSLNKNTERKNINFTKSMFVFMRTYYMVRSLTASFQALSDTMVNLEGNYLRGEALLRVYGNGMDEMFGKLKQNFGIGRTTASSALSVLNEQLLQMNMSGEKLTDTMTRVSEVTQMISGVSGSTFKESANILARSMAGNTRGLAGAVGFRMDDRLLSGLSPEMKGMEVLKQLENYLRQTQTGGIYLNNKTIAQLKESFVDGFRDMFHKIYQTLGGERMGSGYNLLVKLLDSLNIRRITEGLSHFFDLFDKASKSGNIKKIGEIISETMYMLFTYPLEILGNIGLIKLVGKLGAFKTLLILPLMNLINLLSDGKLEKPTEFLNKLAKDFYSGFKEALTKISEADFPILSNLSSITLKVMTLLEKFLPYFSGFAVTMTRFADKVLAGLDALLDIISNPLNAVSTFKKYREERDSKQLGFFGKKIDHKDKEQSIDIFRMLEIGSPNRTYETLDIMKEINPELYKFSKKMGWLEEYDPLKFNWFIKDMEETAFRNSHKFYNPNTFTREEQLEKGIKGMKDLFRPAKNSLERFVDRIFGFDKNPSIFNKERKYGNNPLQFIVEYSKKNWEFDYEEIKNPSNVLQGLSQYNFEGSIKKDIPKEVKMSIDLKLSGEIGYDEKLISDSVKKGIKVFVDEQYEQRIGGAY